MTSIIWPVGCARVWNRPSFSLLLHTKKIHQKIEKLLVFLLKTVLRLAPSPILDVSTALTTIQLSWSADCWLCFYNTINHIDWLWCCGGSVFIYLYCYNPTQQYTTLNHLFRISFTFVGCKYFSSNTNLWTRLEFLLCC